ncbi:MAG: helix-turn-helix domain-containing protein [Prevotellaceae bacterium]|jgi:excisionase family DNA binding protein|nr:helix-turn-helix domain-containing protein [Prevotellaceae bacterium]
MATVLYELLNESPNIKIEISLANLIEAIDYSVKSTRDELEAQIRDSHQEQYLSPDRAAELLDVTKPTLWRWDKNDYLKPVSIGGKRRYRYSDLKRILEK